MNNIDYKAVIEIINNFLNNEKVEIFGISIGEERQVRIAIENLLKERQADKDRIKELEEMDLTTVYLSGFYDGEKKWKDKIKAMFENYKESSLMTNNTFEDFKKDLLKE